MSAPPSVVDLLRDQSLHVRDLYKLACASHFMELKRARRGIWFMCLWLFVSTVIIVFVAYDAFTTNFTLYEDDLAEWRVFAVLACLQVIIIVAGLAYAFVHRSGWYCLRNPRLQELDLSKAPNFQNVALEVASRFNVSRKEVRWWRETSLATSASILRSGGKVHIVVPLPLIVRATRDPDGAKALLAHEFAHLEHKDSELLVWTETFANYFTVVFAINGVLTLLGWIISGFKDLNWHQYLPWYLANQACENLLLARRKAEFMADLRAAMELGAPTYIRVLNETVKDDKSEDTNLDDRFPGGDQKHPQKRLRLIRVALLWSHPGMPHNQMPVKLEQFHHSVLQAYRVNEPPQTRTNTISG